MRLCSSRSASLRKRRISRSPSQEQGEHHEKFDQRMHRLGRELGQLERHIDGEIERTERLYRRHRHKAAMTEQEVRGDARHLVSRRAGVSCASRP
ncbi:MAG: hypothetical protein KDK03_04140 [Rhodobacteraceae bacterium]|nr:hypothetical protein [Paracoccaceae bacterium]